MKTKVLDTNVILDFSLNNIIEKFTQEKDNTCINLPLSVIKELDNFKKGSATINYNARRTLAMLEELRVHGRTINKRLHQGIPVNDKCTVQVLIDEKDLNLDQKKVDNDIIMKTMKLIENTEEDVKISTLDLHVRILADCLDVDSEIYEQDMEDHEIYSGIEVIEITDEEVFEICKPAKERKIITDKKLLTNQLVIMKDSIGNEYEGIHRGGFIYPLKKRYRAWGILPKANEYGTEIREQKMLMHLLLDPEISFVSALGPSGCGKTLLALACALEQTLNSGMYEKIIVMRPLTDIGKDLGSLPGDKLEKLFPWMGSTFDNLEFLLERFNTLELSGIEGTAKEKVNYLIKTGVIELEAMQFIRGRSIPNQFIIVDDGQNLTPHEAATIITRAGEGTKVVFLGDISEKQIDNHRLNPMNNGLTHVVNRFKGADETIGHVNLTTVVRSKLASLGVNLL